MAPSGPAGKPTLLVDADACPVRRIVVAVARKRGLAVVFVCDWQHVIDEGYGEVVSVDPGADSADFVLANRARSGDIVVTQDYGLAALCLGKGARPMHPSGLVFTHDNIDGLLAERHHAKKTRWPAAARGGPKKRTDEDDARFRDASSGCSTPERRAGSPRCDRDPARYHSGYPCASSSSTTACRSATDPPHRRALRRVLGRRERRGGGAPSARATPRAAVRSRLPRHLHAGDERPDALAEIRDPSGRRTSRRKAAADRHVDHHHRGEGPAGGAAGAPTRSCPSLTPARRSTRRRPSA
jgi:hypothetical protein